MYHERPLGQFHHVPLDSYKALNAFMYHSRSYMLQYIFQLFHNVLISFYILQSVFLLVFIIISHKRPFGQFLHVPLDSYKAAYISNSFHVSLKFFCDLRCSDCKYSYIKWICSNHISNYRVSALDFLLHLALSVMSP